jgi:hypothetical protein
MLLSELMLLEAESDLIRAAILIGLGALAVIELVQLLWLAAIR